jgi:hypothetical protein
MAAIHMAWYNCVKYGKQKMIIGRVLLYGAAAAFVWMVCLGGHAAAEDVTKCVQRCQMLCGYFPDNPECQRQADRCVARCKFSPKNSS